MKSEPNLPVATASSTTAHNEVQRGARGSLTSEKLPDDASRALTASALQAARICGVSESTWWKLHAARRIPAPVKIGRATRWVIPEIHRWLEAGAPARDAWDRQRRSS